MSQPAQRNLLQVVWDGRERTGDTPILTFVDVKTDGGLSEDRRSYADLWRNGSAVADALEQAGMKAGDTFALIMHNHAEFVDAMVGAAMSGTVYVPVDPRMTGDKLVYMLSFTDCRGAIVADYAVGHVLAVLDQLPLLEWLWVVGKQGPHEGGRLAISPFGPIKAAGGERPLRKVDPAEPMQMIFTSGTTGNPKAICSPHARFMFAASIGSMIGLNPGDRPYTGLPLSHSNAQLMTLGNALSMGLPAVISRRFTKSRLWEILTRYGCTTFNLLGGMTTAIFAEPPGPFDRAHNVRFVLSAGMPPSMWRDFGHRFGVEIFEFFGTAEGGLTLNPPGGPVGSIGKAPAGTICAVLDADAHEVPAGELGELCFRNSDGTVAAVRYHKNDAASEDKTRGGWFHSGDFGWKDDDGWLYFAYRGGTAIRRNGEFISPSEVETVLADHPSVSDVFVYGVATAHNAPGEREVVAAVVPRQDLGFDPVSLHEWCRARLSTNAQPRFIQLVEEIPKTASEKPQERVLLDMLAAGGGKVFGVAGWQNIELGERK